MLNQNQKENTERPTKAYKVFCVRELREMLREAEKYSIENYGEVKDQQTLVVDYEIAEAEYDNNERVQLSFRVN